MPEISAKSRLGSNRKSVPFLEKLKIEERKTRKLKVKAFEMKDLGMKDLGMKELETNRLKAGDLETCSHSEGGHGPMQRCIGGAATNG